MFDRLSVLLGLSQQNVKRYLLVFLVLMGVMIYLAVESGFAFYQRYLQSYAIPSEVQETPSEAERILKEASAPKWVSEGDLLPRGVLNETGQLVYCTDALSGESGVKYGWVWDAETDGCRKFRGTNVE